ncbi:MAG: diadenylate cyclase CdaA [Clostridia bacterium]|nr:diadenylate cyclase CdaA [Clostridia bacterium]
MKESINNFFNAIYALFNQIIYAIANISFFDIIDIIIVAFIVYKAVEFLRESRAGMLLKGIAILLVVSVGANLFDLVSLKWLLAKLFDYALIAIVVVFQPELRRALEKVGRSNITAIAKGQFNTDVEDTINACIANVCKSVVTMSDKKIGALIVFERDTRLGDIANTGTLINADASPEMIGNIFFPKSPLHDGGMLIRDGRILAAGCILPLTTHSDLNSQLGTRHRAAIGMSENSDAVVVVVSEETGTISVAVNGVMTRDYNSVTLRDTLTRELITDESKPKNRFGDVWDKSIKIFKKK